MSQAKNLFDAQLEYELAKQSTKFTNESNAMLVELTQAKAEAKAKDIVIAAKETEIARLDELLKVTMSKLTQIDVKGLTIHVENDHSFKKSDKE